MITICKKFHFDSAHHLPHYQGRCSNLHGHRWEVEVEYTGEIQTDGPKTGMIVDFHDLEQYVHQVAISKLDHTNLNSINPNPTAELILKWIVDKIAYFSEEHTLVRVRLYESPDSYVEWRGY